MHLFLAANWLLDPIVGVLAWVVSHLNLVIPNLGLCLVVLALLIRVLFWPLNTAQFRAMIAMQKIAPTLKKLQERYGKSDPEKYRQETMALYKSSGANPLAGCWPMLVQYPIIISVYYMVRNKTSAFSAALQHTSFLWINPALHHDVPRVFGASLWEPDWIFIILYAISMYVSMRFTTMPPTDKAQAQQMKIMQIFSPLMIGFFAFRYAWPSALVVYWLSYNVFTMGQQFYLLRKYHQPLSVIDSDHAVVEAAAIAAAPPPAALPSANGAPSAGKSSKSSKKKKKGAHK